MSFENIEEMTWKPVELTSGKDAFPDKGEAMIIEARDIFGGEYLEISYYTMDSPHTFVERNIKMKTDDVLENAEPLIRFSDRWKKAMLVNSFIAHRKTDDNMWVLRELTDEENIKDYGLEEYFE
jgi:hypothetical protein